MNTRSFRSPLVCRSAAIAALSIVGLVIEWRRLRCRGAAAALGNLPASIKTLKQMKELTDRLHCRAFGVSRR
jgi:hypothetical protein